MAEEQLGYSLVDVNTNAEVKAYGTIQGQTSGVPDKIELPNGDVVHCPALNGTYNGFKLVPRVIVDEKPAENSEWYRKTDEVVSYDTNTKKTIITTVYPDEPNILPSSVTPLQMRRALRQLNIRDQFEVYVAGLSDDEKDEWQYSLEIKSNNKIVANAMVAIAKSTTKKDIYDLFRLASSIGADGVSNLGGKVDTTDVVITANTADVVAVNPKFP